jgi:hypothetical protein
MGHRFRYESFEYRARPFSERIEPPETFFANHRFAVPVDDRDYAPAYQEAPFASHAVVEPRRPSEQVALTLRSDHEIVFEPRGSLRIRGFAP